MAKQWQIKHNGKAKGPFSDSQLRKLVASGRIDRKTPVRASENAIWLVAERVPGLFPDESEKGQHNKTDSVQFAPFSEGTPDSAVASAIDIESGAKSKPGSFHSPSRWKTASVVIFTVVALGVFASVVFLFFGFPNLNGQRPPSSNEIRGAVLRHLNETLNDSKIEVVRWFPEFAVRTEAVEEDIRDTRRNIGRGFNFDDVKELEALPPTGTAIRLKYRAKNLFGALQLHDFYYVIENKIVVTAVDMNSFNILDNHSKTQKVIWRKFLEMEADEKGERAAPEPEPVRDLRRVFGK